MRELGIEVIIVIRQLVLETYKVARDYLKGDKK